MLVAGAKVLLCHPVFQLLPPRLPRENVQGLPKRDLRHFWSDWLHVLAEGVA